MGLREVAERELQDGLARLRGAHLNGTLPLRQAVLNDLLRLAGAAPQDLRLELGADNEVVARYGVLHFTARIHREVALAPTPVLTIELASRVAAWALQQASLPPFARVTGRHIRIDLSRVPALRAAAPLWPHVARLAVTSRSGRLDLHVTIHVRDEEQQ